MFQGIEMRFIVAALVCVISPIAAGLSVALGADGRSLIVGAPQGFERPARKNLSKRATRIHTVS